jgi:hypothetical protein
MVKVLTEFPQHQLPRKESSEQICQTPQAAEKKISPKAAAKQFINSDLPALIMTRTLWRKGSGRNLKNSGRWHVKAAQALAFMIATHELRSNGY